MTISYIWFTKGRFLDSWRALREHLKKWEKLTYKLFENVLQVFKVCTFHIWIKMTQIKNSHKFFAVPPIKRWSLFPQPLSQGWPGNLLWALGCSRSGFIWLLRKVSRPCSLPAPPLAALRPPRAGARACLLEDEGPRGERTQPPAGTTLRPMSKDVWTLQPSWAIKWPQAH